MSERGWERGDGGVQDTGSCFSHAFLFGPQMKPRATLCLSFPVPVARPGLFLGVQG